MVRLKSRVRALWRVLLEQDSGQDLIEYTLLLAFVALSATSLFLSSGSSVNQVWSSANSVLAQAAGPAGSTAQPSGGGGGDRGDR